MQISVPPLTRRTSVSNSPGELKLSINGETEVAAGRLIFLPHPLRLMSKDMGVLLADPREHGDSMPSMAAAAQISLMRLGSIRTTITPP